MGEMYTLNKNAEGDWIREVLHINNKPKDHFLICAFDADEDKELYVMGFSNTENGPKGAVYKIMN